MVIPSKEENLHKSLIFLGYDIVKLLKKKEYNIEDLFLKMKDIKQINLYQFYNTLTFLAMFDIIVYENYTVRLVK
ncbi:hypothetical protein LV89_04258 [Arcicella aurantiaca]|uniref:Uncharacterized protein n=1 Tax=Arcicella aurantiaca TaxID=591202 RepID=A0A316DI14_9BACT|nr:ABC-three component system middle component 6 [Arcicella aurantiaca]PWK17811.1 hypothetical protein LV89_04258 [Arcicella aurantiaca]